MKLWLDRTGTVGAIIAAMACPVCFPKLALVGAALGLGVFAPFERYVSIAIQLLVIVALIGHVWAFRRHRNLYLLALALAGTAAVLSAYNYFFLYIEPLIYSGLAAHLIASVWLVRESRKCAACSATGTN